jgi:XRE family aerobic/anaerobic benzoate catabolism transcriptional regulator
MTKPGESAVGLAATEGIESDTRHPLLASLGDRLRTLRAQRGLTRKAVAIAADVSERHLANLEYGVGNASLLVLQQIATALHCSLAELLGDFTTQSPEWLLIRDMLEPCTEVELRRVRTQLGELLGSAGADAARPQRIALIGLRGAGKTTLGQMLAENLDVPFVELSREVERLAGCSVREIYDLYGTTAYRRYERRALDEVVKNYSQVVIRQPSISCLLIAPRYGCRQHPMSIWGVSSPRGILVLSLRATRPWTTCDAF